MAGAQMSILPISIPQDTAPPPEEFWAFLVLWLGTYLRDSVGLKEHSRSGKGLFQNPV